MVDGAVLRRSLIATSVWFAASMLTGAMFAQSASRDEVRLSAPAVRPDSLVAASRGSLAALVWSAGPEASPALMVSVSRDGGRTFTEPKSIGPVHGSNSKLKATVAISANSGVQDTISVAWPSRQGDVDGITLARSRDFGRSFSSVFLRATGVPTRAIPSALALSPSGTLHVVWLADAQVMYARTEKDSMTSPLTLDGASSRCGVAAMAAGPGDAVSIFWHRQFGKDDEEFAFRSSSNGGRSFEATTRVSGERWGFTSCPAQSPSLTIDPGGALRFVFQTSLPGTATESVFLVDRTTDRRTFRPRAYLDAPGFAEARSPVLVPDGQGGLSLTWDGLRNGRRYVIIRHSRGAPGVTAGIEADWMRPSPPIVLDQSGSGSGPAVTRTPEGMLTAWVVRNSGQASVMARRMTIDQLCGDAP